MSDLEWSFVAWRPGGRWYRLGCASRTRSFSTGLNWTGVFLEQKVQMLEAVTMGCIEQPNSYDIIDASNNRKIMVQLSI